MNKLWHYMQVAAMYIIVFLRYGLRNIFVTVFKNNWTKAIVTVLLWTTLGVVGIMSVMIMSHLHPILMVFLIVVAGMGFMVYMIKSDLDYYDHWR